MAATVELHYPQKDPVVIECNYAKIRDNCVQIAHDTPSSAKFALTCIPLHKIDKAVIFTDKGDKN